MIEQIISINIKGYDGLISISSEYESIYPDYNPKENISLKNIPFIDNVDEITDNNCKIIYVKNPTHEFANIMLLEETEYQLSFQSKDEFADKNIFYSLKIKDDENKSHFTPMKIHKKNQNDKSTLYIGYLNFKRFVGKAFIDIKKDEIVICKIPIEVRSKKMDYIYQYPTMIGYLSEIASGLIFGLKSPVYQKFELNSKKSRTKYEDFMLLEYIFRPENLPSTFEYLSKNLYSQLAEYVEPVPTSLALNVDSNELIDIVSSSKNLSKCSNSNNLRLCQKLNGYMPLQVNEIKYQENIDTPENRFYKNFLELIDYKIDECLESVDAGYSKDKLLNFSDESNYFLSQRYFKDINKMDYPPLNSQVLQKKEGYREILKYFLMIEFSYMLEWDEVTNDFKGFQKRLHDLYEYWGFFELIKILSNITNTKPYLEDIFQINNKKWNLSLKKGKESEIQFNKIKNDNHEISISLYYNLKFNPKGNENKNKYHKSYSMELKPDYTLKIKIDTCEYLLHFDAKYKIKERKFTKNGINETIKDSYNPIDIDKMHTYKDAIYNTFGAYILYPGSEDVIFEEEYEKKIPSVGAFKLNPLDINDDTNELNSEELEIKNFITDVISQLL